MIVEIDLHSHRSQRLDEMGFVWQHKSGMAGLKDRLGFRLEHFITHSTIQHPNDSPYALLGPMLLA